MAIPNEELLEYLRQLTKKLGKDPTVLDVKHDGKFSWSIFKKRFGGFPNAIKKSKGIEIIFKKSHELINEGAESRKDFFQQKGRYNGAAAEFLVIAELLYRGINANKLPFDEGVDIIATKENKTFYIQVKNITVEKDGKYKIDLRLSSFDKTKGYNMYYVFVVNKKDRTYLILPFIKLQEFVKKGYFKIQKDSKQFTILLNFQRDKCLICANDNLQEEDISTYMNDWDIIV